MFELKCDVANEGLLATRHTGHRDGLAIGIVVVVVEVEARVEKTLKAKLQQL